MIYGKYDRCRKGIADCTVLLKGDSWRTTCRTLSEAPADYFESNRERPSCTESEKCNRYLSGLQYEEGNPQILVRSDIPKGTYERILLHNEIFEIIYNDVVYDYDKDFVEDENVIHGLQKELLGELRAGRVYTIYDKERI